MAENDPVVISPQAKDKKILLALIGHPVAHSLSPVMHKTAFTLCGIAGDYILVDIPPAELASRLPQLKRELNGFNVTVPHKQAVIPFMTRMTEIAAKIGAVNTVRVEEDGDLTGHNTDAGGFLRALKAQDAVLEGITATIFGAGGAARAAVWALSTVGVSKIIVAARNEEAARSLASDFWQPANDTLIIESRILGQPSDKSMLAVNCVPLGLNAEDELPGWFAAEMDALAPDALFFDMVYAHGKVPLLTEAARQHGLRATDGSAMLVGQAALAFEFWTGCSAPFNAMRRALNGQI